jgi:lambda repressor-like predicted transcriptional regulator
MADGAFWRDLRSQFESLQNPTDRRTVAHNLNGKTWDFSSTGPFYSRFCTFATRGGAQATGAIGDAAVDAWLDLLVERVPHHYKGNITGVSLEHEDRQIVLSDIDPPNKTSRELPPQRDPVFMVEPHGERFVVVRGHALYDEYQRQGLSIVKCRVSKYVETSSGRLHELREASMELCELLETDAVQGIDGQLLSQATLTPDARVTRRAFIEPLLEKKGWSTFDWAIEATVDPNTATDYLAGTTRPHRNTRKKLADALGVPVEQLPK